MYTADTQLSVSVRGKLWKAGISREMSISATSWKYSGQEKTPSRGRFFRIKFWNRESKNSVYISKYRPRTEYFLRDKF